MEINSDTLNTILEATELVGQIKYLREHDPSKVHLFGEYMTTLRTYVPILQKHPEIPGVQRILDFAENPPEIGSGNGYGYGR